MVLALIYDFDGTLSPGNMQEYDFIPAVGKDNREFWDNCNRMAEQNDADPILTYMNEMIRQATVSGVSLRREAFAESGRKVKLYEGVESWFSRINRYGQARGVQVEHYINSSGLAEMIEGSPIAGEFKRIFACSFLYNENGEAEWPGVAVDYTAKTQFLFKINKGILSIRDNKRVNESQLEENKRIPFPSMIYFGDGETDVPCMKIVKMFGGNSIAVYNPKAERKKHIARKLLRQKRVNFICPADYSAGSRMYRIVCAIIDKIKAEYELKKLEEIKVRNV